MIAAVILAGGEGSRIGGEKPLRLLRGRTLLEWAFANARVQCDRVAVSVRDGNELAGATLLPLLVDDRQKEGPLAGLSAALEWASREGADWVLTLPCDTPFAPHDLAARLFDAASHAQTSCAIARSGGVAHPACAIWRTNLNAQLVDYLAAGRLSVIGFAERARCGIAEWKSTPFDPFFNVNTPADLDEAERIAAQFH